MIVTAHPCMVLLAIKIKMLGGNSSSFPNSVTELQWVIRKRRARGITKVRHFLFGIVSPMPFTVLCLSGCCPGRKISKCLYFLISILTIKSGRSMLRAFSLKKVPKGKMPLWSVFWISEGDKREKGIEVKWLFIYITTFPFQGSDWLYGD